MIIELNLTEFCWKVVEQVIWSPEKVESVQDQVFL